MKRPDYGIDAPGLLRFFGFAGAACSCIAVAIAWAIDWSSILGIAVFCLLAALAGYLLGMCCLMFVWSKVVKVGGREAILDLVTWRGDELVLDVGCGRGLMLVGAARRLTDGKAYGIDLWQAKDQSDNTPDAPIRNAVKEGVQDRVEVKTADMRELPFADASFDVVMSHWVVHNLDLSSDRQRALHEMRRVLRPGGDLILADISLRDEYVDELRRLDFQNVRLILNPLADKILRAVSFGSFGPATIHARRAV